MRNKSVIRIIGNVGADPTSRFLPDGTQVTSFSVAVNEPAKRAQEGGEEITAWYRVSAWRRQAEIVADILRKGMAVQVEGAFHPRAYVNREGASALSLDIAMSDFDILTPKALDATADAASGPAPQARPAPASTPVAGGASARPADEDLYDGDLPF